jgi:putative ABC transport system substrate-binding protein
VAVIVTPVGAGALAAKAATTTIPVVFGLSDDPVKLGLVANLARPGGNATGINFLNAEAVAKRLGLLRDLVPKAVRIAVLVDPANVPPTEATLRDMPEAARALGLQIQVLKASTSPPRDRGGLRRPRTRSCRRPLRRPRRVLQQPARPTCDARSAS